jgi:cytochrome c oxidase subunit 2
MLNELFRKLLWLPPQSTELAAHIDYLHYFVFIITVLGGTIVPIIGLYFVIKFRKTEEAEVDKPGATIGDNFVPPTKPPHGHIPLKYELMAIFGLLAAFLVWWVIGFRQFVQLRTPPENTLDVYVMGKKWMWKFAYPEGGGSVSTLYVPTGKPVKLIMTSRDVLHSFFIPEFRVKEDAIPGRYTTLWFQVDKPGTYEIFCTEYCGTGHSMMRGEVVALSPEDYERWKKGQKETLLAKQNYEEPGVVSYNFSPREQVNLAIQGQRAAAQYGCLRCHSVDGSAYIGPTWAGMYNSKIQLTNGQTIIADEAYLTRAMMDPTYEIHDGYKAVMPTYQGMMRPAETAAILEYIKSLRDAPPKLENGGTNLDQVNPFNWEQGAGAATPSTPVGVDPSAVTPTPATTPASNPTPTVPSETLPAAPGAVPPVVAPGIVPLPKP